MSPVSLAHDSITDYLRDLFKTYLTLKPIGKVLAAPFVMRLANARSWREPDLQIILNANLDKFTRTGMRGAADICIEVVSPNTAEVDYSEKYLECQAGGVQEYWIMDSLRSTVNFHRLNAAGVYEDHQPDEQGNYRTPSLPQFVLHVPTLWQDDLPDVISIVETIKTMVQG